MTLDVGSIAPDFSLKNQFGELVTLSEFKGRKNVVLMFYPLHSPVSAQKNCVR